MGCCFSSSKKRHRSSRPCSATNGRDPPLVEEETVKEVLSETPIIPKLHCHPPPPPPPKVKKEADFPQVKIESTAVIKPRDEMKIESTAVVKPRDEVKIESTAVIKPEVSEELSEMCSFTESYSTTATATEKREEEGEVSQKSPVRVHRKRQNSGDIAGVRERSFRSQAGRSAPSPEKRRSPASSRGVQGRGMPQQRRNVGPPRRGPSDNGVRRSNSRATSSGTVDGRRNVRNRSPAAAEVASEGDKPSRQSSPARSTPEVVAPWTGESLENPLVSMECFIFL